MPEIDNNQAADNGADNGANDSENKPDVEQENKPTDDGNGEAGDENQDGGDPNDPDKGQDKDAKVPQKKADDNNEDDPPVRYRKDNKFFVVGRKNAKIKKLTETKNKDNENQDDNENDDNQVAPEDAEIITKVVKPLIEPLVEQNLQAQDDKEITAFVKANPEFAKYEEKARKWIAHPSRRHLPVETVFFEVAGKDLLKIGAERQKEADKKAKNSQTGGGSNRGGDPGKKSVLDMTDEEFANEQERVRRGEKPQQ